MKKAENPKTSNHICTHPRRSARREKALARQVAREKRNPEQQLKVLDDRLGKGKGAKKERDKLGRQLLYQKKGGAK